MTLQDKIQTVEREYQNKVNLLEEEKQNKIHGCIVDDLFSNMEHKPICSIIELFENLSQDILQTKNGKKNINGFVKLIREDRNLLNIYLVRENMLSPNATPSVIDETISFIIGKSSKNDVAKSKAKLVNFVKESLQNVSNEVLVEETAKKNDEVIRLYENIDFIASYSKSLKNLVECEQKIKELKGFVSENVKKGSKSTSENVTESKTAQEVFCEEKEKCIKLIDEAWNQAEDSALKMKLTEMKENLINKEFSEITQENDLKFIEELKNTLS